LETEKSVDIRKELFYKLAEAKLPIMAMNQLERSLEDAFLELTDEKGGAEDGGNL